MLQIFSRPRSTANRKNLKKSFLFLLIFGVKKITQIT